MLISGRGSNMLALERATRDGRIDGRIVSVISDRADAAGPRGRRRRSGSKHRSSRRARGEDREAFGQRLSDAHRASGAELVALAGFMRILDGGFVRAWQGRLLNIHPSLLPAYRGLHTHRRVLEAGERQHGCTVHFVVEELDAGPAVIQGRLARAARRGRKQRFQRAFSVWNTLFIRGRSAGSPPGGSHGGTALRCWTGARRDP